MTLCSEAAMGRCRAAVWPCFPGSPWQTAALSRCEMTLPQASPRGMLHG